MLNSCSKGPFVVFYKSEQIYFYYSFCLSTTRFLVIKCTLMTLCLAFLNFVIMPIEASSSSNVYRTRAFSFRKRKDGLNGLWSAVSSEIVRRFGNLEPDQHHRGIIPSNYPRSCSLLSKLNLFIVTSHLQRFNLGGFFFLQWKFYICIFTHLVAGQQKTRLYFFYMQSYFFLFINITLLFS